MCRAAQILRLRSRFVDGLLPLACGQSVHNYNMRTTWALVVCRAQSTGTADNKGAGSGPRLRARRFTSAGKGRRQARQLNAAGFSFAVVGRGELLMLLPFKAMLLLERARGRKSGGSPLLAPSFKVQRITAHNQSSGFTVAHGLKTHNARGPLKVQGASGRTSGNQGGPGARV